MTELEFHDQKGNEAKHGHAPIQLFRMAVKAITGQATLGNFGRFNHGSINNGLRGGKSIVGKQAFLLETFNSLGINNLLLLELVINIRPRKRSICAGGRINVMTGPRGF